MLRYFLGIYCCGSDLVSRIKRKQKHVWGTITDASLDCRLGSQAEKILPYNTFNSETASADGDIVRIIGIMAGEPIPPITHPPSPQIN